METTMVVIMTITNHITSPDKSIKMFGLSLGWVNVYAGRTTTLH